MVRSAACSISGSFRRLQRMSRQQLVRMHPAGQGLDSIEPGADGGKVAPAYAEFIRPEEIAASGDVGDRRLVADDELLLLQVQIEDRHRALDAAAEEFGDGRLAGLLE